MAAKRPFLAAVPEGDAKKFIEKSGNGFTCEPDNVDKMSKIILDIYNSWKNNSERQMCNTKFIEKFERRHLTQKLTDEIDKIFI